MKVELILLGSKGVTSLFSCLLIAITLSQEQGTKVLLDRKSDITSISFVEEMSSVFCNDSIGVRSILTKAVSVRRVGSTYIVA